MPKEQELQQKYLEIQIKEQQIKQTHEQLTNIAHHVQELNKIQETLDEIKKTKKGTEILVPIGSGIYVKADIKDTKELLIGVGSKVHVNKDVDETKKLIDHQIMNMEELSMEIEHKLHSISGEVQDIQQELLQSMQEQSKD